MSFIKDRLIPLDSSPREYQYFHKVIPEEKLEFLNSKFELFPIPSNSDNSIPLLERVGCNIPLTEDTNKFYTTLFYYLTEANKKYNFDIDWFEQVQYFEYSKNSDGLDWHMDLGDGVKHNRRKISFSLFLNDSDEFEGGDLEINTGWGSEIMTKSKGSIVFFPSYLLHRVTPITKGIRKVIVGFIGGRPFK
tara:strand:+ start:54 stop:626 length:573 start_codon:yes stop_codon:yes gene_type:complete